MSSAPSPSRDKALERESKDEAIRAARGAGRDRPLPDRVGLVAIPSRRGRKSMPTIAPMKTDATLKGFLEKNTMSFTAGAVLCHGLAYAYLKFSPADGFPELYPKIPKDAIPADLLKDEDTMEFIRVLDEDQRIVMEFTYDMIACFQTAPLKETNVASYFKATKSIVNIPAKYVTMAEWVANRLPPFDVGGLRAEMSSWNPFIDYHTRAFSSSSLVLRFMEENSKLCKIIFPNVKKDDVMEVEAKCYDLAESYRLPKTLLAMTQIWVNVNRLVDNTWWQGEKALAMQTAGFKDRWTTYFEKSRDLQRIETREVKSLDELDDMVKDFVHETAEITDRVDTRH